MTTIKSYAGLATLFAALVSFSADAGGFARNEADTDLLFEDGKIVFRIGGAYVMPNRSYTTLNGKPATNTTAFTQDYFMPSIGLKAQIGTIGGCVLTYNQPFGGAASYTKETQAAGGLNPTVRTRFTSNEFGGTCNIKFAASPGQFHVIGGVFVQTFDYLEEARFGTLQLRDNGKFGFRAGVAYDIPQYAMRAQLLYRSQINQSASGSFQSSPIGQFVGIPSVPLPATGAGTLPQSVKLSLQSGIAPDWLAFGSVTWTNWSVLNTLNYNITALGPRKKIFNYKDGWTVQAGLGHRFNDTFSGSVSVTWDQGVGSGADISTDTWTFGTGVEMRTNYGTLGVGGAVSLLKGGAQSTAANPAGFNATAKDSWATSLGVRYMVKY